MLSDAAAGAAILSGATGGIKSRSTAYAAIATFSLAFNFKFGRLKRSPGFARLSYLRIPVETFTDPYVHNILYSFFILCQAVCFTAKVCHIISTPMAVFVVLTIIARLMLAYPKIRILTTVKSKKQVSFCCSDDRRFIAAAVRFRMLNLILSTSPPCRCRAAPVSLPRSRVCHTFFCPCIVPLRP